MKKLQIITFSALALILVSCNEGRDARLRPADVSGVSGLETEEFVSLRDYLASPTSTYRFPKNGENIEFNVALKKTNLSEFLTMDTDGEEVRCRYEFDKANITQQIAVEGVLGEDEDTRVFSRVETLSPIEPTYAGIPYSEAQKTLCDADLAKLQIVREPVVLDLATSHNAFKNFLNRQIIEVFQSCSKGIKIDGANCLGARVSTFIRTESPVLVYSLKTSFDWMNDAGTRYTTNQVLEFSPTMTYFSPIGLLNLEGDLVRGVQSIELPYSAMTLQDLNIITE